MNKNIYYVIASLAVVIVACSSLTPGETGFSTPDIITPLPIATASGTQIENSPTDIPALTTAPPEDLSFRATTIELEKPVTSIAYIDERDQVLISTASGVYDFQNDQLAVRIPGLSQVADIDASPDGMYLAVITQEAHVQIYETNQNTLVTERQLSLDGYPYADLVKWSPDGKKLGIGAERYALVWFPWDNRLELATQHGLPMAVLGLSWSPTSDRLLSGAPDGIRSWSLENDDWCSFNKERYSVHEIVWRQDSQIVVSGGEPVSVLLLVPTNCEVVDKIGFEQHLLEWDMINSLAWRPGENSLAFGTINGNVGLLKLDSHEIILFEDSHEAMVLKIVWAGEDILYSWGNDGTLFKWE